jgi:hypothetical protein
LEDDKEDYKCYTSFVYVVMTSSSMATMYGSELLFERKKNGKQVTIWPDLIDPLTHAPTSNPYLQQNQI